jgi:hypothetical protein
VSRSGILLLLTAGSVALLAGCASHHPARPGSPRPHTVTETFAAYRADGELAVHVADVATGRCWTTSIAAPGSGAYRCITGNSILDPCFAPPTPATPVEVACMASPWSDAEVLRVTGALPTGTPGTHPARPWAVQLANGVRCVAATGTVPAVHGVNLGYHCLDGANAALGDTSAAVVTAEYADPDTQQLRPVTVQTIWRA